MTIAAAAVLGLGCASTDTGNGAPTSPSPEDKSGMPAEADPAADAPADPAAGAPAGGDCAALDAQACKTTEGCQTVRGSHVVAVEGAAAGAAHCVQARADVGCIEAQMCAEAITYFCNDKGEVLEVTSACGPAGWTPCEAPAQIQGACAP